MSYPLAFQPYKCVKKQCFLQSKLDDLLKKLSEYSASIPGAGAVVSVLKDIANAMPVKDITMEYIFLYKEVLGSVSSNLRDVSTALGLLGA